MTLVCVGQPWHPCFMCKLGTACRSRHKIEIDMRIEEKVRGQERGEEDGGRGEGEGRGWEGRRGKVSMGR